jgi:hypothetical protein
MFEFRDRLRVLQERDVLREESGPGSETDAAIKGFDGTTAWCCVLISSAPSMAILVLRCFERTLVLEEQLGCKPLWRSRRRRGGVESQDGLGGGQLSCDRQPVLLSAIATVEICGLHSHAIHHAIQRRSRGMHCSPRLIGAAERRENSASDCGRDS